MPTGQSIASTTCLSGNGVGRILGRQSRLW